MKTLHLISLVPALALMSCATPGSFATSIGPESWESEHFTVRFFAGSRSFEDHKSSSYYEVIPTRLGPNSRIIASSAHTTSGFAGTTNPEPRNYIKVLSDSDSEALIIQETIPNDCGPCTNYIWIRPDSQATFTHSYLQLPELGMGATDAIDSEFPEVMSLKDGQLTYRYSKGAAITANAASIPAKPEPTPPG